MKGEGRSGRWKGKNKKECGLHPSYFNKKINDKVKNYKKLGIIIGVATSDSKEIKNTYSI